MSKHTQLFELLSELIDVQIKKYVKLATVGVGPDARPNAALVYEEVSELLESASSLLETIEKKSNDAVIFSTVFNQIKFYLEQESFRSSAGWLLDSNNIHDTVDARTKIQLEQLEILGREAVMGDFTEEAQPTTPVQLQCQHDSFEIAHRILTLARNVRDYPAMEIDEKIPDHAKLILRKNATTRYVQFQKEIDDQYQQCVRYLTSSSLHKRTSLLTKEDALSHKKTHRLLLTTLLEKYKKIHPDSRLFLDTYQAPTVASPEQPKPSNYSIPKISFFICATVGVGYLLQQLLPYLSSFAQEDINCRGLMEFDNPVKR